MISAAAPVAPPRERIVYNLDDFDLLATLGTMGIVHRRPCALFSLLTLLLCSAHGGDNYYGETTGTGTFGRVRLVRLRDVGSFHALKILKKSEILRLQQLHHIKCEVEILSKIEHPFIVSYLGHFQDERRLYLVLEYVQGGELFSYLRRQGRFADHVACYYTTQLVLAIAYLHAQHIIYRDLKPENLLITSEGSIKITDFGFAKIVEDRTWTLCGTPEYLAPEIIQSKGHGKSVDWWALGVLIYEMLAGYPPFYDENPFGIYQKILNGKVDFPKHIDSKAKDLIKKLLSQDRTKRLGKACLLDGTKRKCHRDWRLTDVALL